jgi:hypothetical protein
LDDEILTDGPAINYPIKEAIGKAIEQTIK